MNEVRLDPQQVPARAELLLAAELGEDAPGRPIYGRAGARWPRRRRADAARIKVGSILTRRLSAAEATETPSGAAYGNPLRGRPGTESRACRSGPRSLPEPTRWTCTVGESTA